jgi:hypothetical protein
LLYTYSFLLAVFKYTSPLTALSGASVNAPLKCIALARPRSAAVTSTAAEPSKVLLPTVSLLATLSAVTAAFTLMLGTSAVLA